MGSNSSRHADYDRSTIILPRSRFRSRHRNNHHQRRSDDQEIINEYHEIISNHQVIDTINKSKKQKSNNLKNYHIIKLDHGDTLMQNECPICLENLEVGDEVYLLPCCHYFHTECLKDWVFRDNVCPTCRDKVGNHTSEQLDLAIFKRDKKNRKAKRTYLNNLSKNELTMLILALDIKTDKNDSTKIIIDKLVNTEKNILITNLKSDNFESDDNYSDESNTEFCFYPNLVVNTTSESNEDNKVSSISSCQSSSTPTSSSNQSFDYDNQVINSNNLRIITRDIKNIILDDEN